MRDFTPEEMAGREYIFSTIKKFFHLYGYQPIETPAMEMMTTLTGKYGEEGDKLLYKVLNSGDFMAAARDAGADAGDSRSLTRYIAEKGLKYDLTVPFARFVVEHYNSLTFPFKRYQIQPVWRADRPQKGRYREFYQCDADVIGSESLLYEYEQLELVDDIFSQLGIKIEIKLNNRKILYGIAEATRSEDRFIAITTAIDKLEKTGIDNVCNELTASELSAEAVQTIRDILLFSGKDNYDKLDYIEKMISGSETGLKGIVELREILQYGSNSGRQLPVTIDLTLARGLNYYTGTIVEVKAKDVEIGSICGGGRYDNLTGVFGMPGMSGMGISFGADRIYDVLNALNLFPDRITSSSKVLIIHFSTEEVSPLFSLAAELRKKGIAVEIYPEPVKLKKQFSYADAKNIEYVVLAGKNELEHGIFGLKNMKTAEQQNLNKEELLQYLLSH